jgi:hypothetical protein
MVGDDLAGSLKASYLAYNNSLRLDLQVLGCRRQTEVSQKGQEWRRQKSG